MIATFTKLLAINMEASNFFGLSNRLFIRCPVLVLFSERSCKSVGLKEKKAVSLPEIIADAMIKIRSRARYSIMLKSNGDRSKELVKIKRGSERGS